MHQTFANLLPGLLRVTGSVPAGPGESLQVAETTNETTLFSAVLRDAAAPAQAYAGGATPASLAGKLLPSAGTARPVPSDDAPALDLAAELDDRSVAFVGGKLLAAPLEGRALSDALDAARAHALPSTPPSGVVAEPDSVPAALAGLKSPRQPSGAAATPATGSGEGPLPPPQANIGPTQRQPAIAAAAELPVNAGSSANGSTLVLGPGAGTPLRNELDPAAKRPAEGPNTRHAAQDRVALDAAREVAVRDRQVPVDRQVPADVPVPPVDPAARRSTPAPEAAVRGPADALATALPAKPAGREYLANQDSRARGRADSATPIAAAGAARAGSGVSSYADVLPKAAGAQPESLEAMAPEMRRPAGEVVDLKPTAAAATVAASGPTVKAAPVLAAAPSTPSATASVFSIDTPVLDPAWQSAVNERVVWMAGRNLQSAELRLNPAELGPLQVQVAVDEKSVSLTISATHPLTREALEGAMPRLREMLAEQGMDLAGATVDDQRAGAREDADEWAGSRTDQDLAQGVAEDEAAAQGRLPAAAPEPTDGAIDLFA